MNRFAILILFCSSISFAQETTPRLRPGIQVASVFSGDEDHGISPALTLTYRRWMFAAGPRFGYERMKTKKNDFYKINKGVVMDAALRYYILSEDKKIRPFAQLAGEYKYRRFAYEQDYSDDAMQYTYGPTFDYAFRGRWDNKRKSFGVYGGFGAEFRIWKQLSAFVFGGAGATFSRSENKLINTGTGTVEYSSKYRSNPQFNWIASAGLGYRF